MDLKTHFKTTQYRVVIETILFSIETKYKPHMPKGSRWSASVDIYLKNKEWKRLAHHEYESSESLVLENAEWSIGGYIKQQERNKKAKAQ